MTAPQDITQGVLRELADRDLPEGESLAGWFDATRRLLEETHSTLRPDALATLGKVWLFSEQYKALEGRPRDQWHSRLVGLCLLKHLGPESLIHLIGTAGSGGSDRAAYERLAARELLLDNLSRRTDDELKDRAIRDTQSAIAMLETLRDIAPSPFGQRVRALFPELAALGVTADPIAAIEHEQSRGGPYLPLLDHLADRVLTRKLAGLERADRVCFQRDEALSAAAFASEVQRFGRLERAGLIHSVRAALLHLDFAKGGTPAQRESWRLRYGADLTVHNLAARRVLEQTRALERYPYFRDRPAFAELVLALIETHGLTGQALRGETPHALFAPFVRYVREGTKHLADVLDVPAGEARSLAFDCLHLINVCDTAGVREGLLTDALADGLLEIEKEVQAVAAASDQTDRETIERELIEHEDRIWAERLPSTNEDQRARARLSDRLARLRQSRIRAGEPVSESARAVAALSGHALSRIVALLRTCQLWYVEAATGGLSAASQLKVLALGAAAADRADAVNTRRPYNLSLLRLVDRLHAGVDRAVPYRVRLLEAMLDQASVDQILSDSRAVTSPLGTFTMDIGGGAGVALSFEESDEAHALLTLLPIYEAKSSAAFHATLKTLCDLYGLRKDEFDRVANEASYLQHMNSAKNDKARMLEYARPGRIVEIGPGGGVVLDLIEQRFPDSEVIGIDKSRMVIEALERRRHAEGRRWKVIEADAFELPEHLGEGTVDTLVFCSVLHEIYSYVEHRPSPAEEPSRFRLEPVRDILRAGYRTLRPGGRILIRDGVMPPPAPRVIRFLTPDAREYFRLFAAQFEGRRVECLWLGDNRVRLSSEDAMEFLYKYTWGPESFPYEIREQYGVRPYDEYRELILEWLGETDREHPPRALALPKEVASYLQAGYKTGLQGKVELFDETGRPVELPDSNCLIVIEKT